MSEMFKEYYASTYLVTLEMKKIIERMIAWACFTPLIRKVLESPFSMLSHDTRCQAKNTVLLHSDSTSDV